MWLALRSALDPKATSCMVLYYNSRSQRMLQIKRKLLFSVLHSFRPLRQSCSGLGVKNSELKRLTVSSC